MLSWACRRRALIALFDTWPATKVSQNRQRGLIMAKTIGATTYGSGRQKTTRVPLGTTPKPAKQKRKTFDY
jgi:hypothetical protein